MKRETPILLALLLLAACNQTRDQGESRSTPVAAIGAHSEPEARTARKAPQLPEPAKDIVPAPTPRSEEALIEAVARALSGRDLGALQGSTTPEFAADLQRMHDLEPSTFWIKGSVFVQHVKTGFEVLHREEDTSDQWNIVVRFGNGHEERMSFTREGGKLRFVDL